MLRKTPLFACAIVLLTGLVGLAAEPAAAGFAPTSDYRQETVGGVTVYVHPRVLEHPKEAEQALKELDKRIRFISSVVSTEHMDAFRKVPIWLKWDSDTLAKYEFGQYNPPAVREQLKQKGFNPDLAGAIEFPNTRNFLMARSWDVLHEMAHAYHHLVLGPSHAGIEAAYKQAIERKLYEKAYAATDKFEYFAELTVVYFGKGNYYPFMREELRTHDPVGFQTLEQVWGAPPTNPPEAAKNRAQGTDLLRRGRYREAIEVLSLSIAQNPDDYLTYNERGAAYTYVNNDTAAISDFSRALALNERYPTAYRSRGAARLRLQHYDDALTDFNRAIQLKPDYARAYRDRSAVYRKLRNAEQADKDEKEAARLEAAK